MLEEDSWELTRRLTDGAAGADEVGADGVIETAEPAATENQQPEEVSFDKEEKTPYELLCSSLPPHALQFLKILSADGYGAAVGFCRKNNLLPDAVVSDINSLAYEHTGDIIIDGENIIEDYKCDVSVALNNV